MRNHFDAPVFQICKIGITMSTPQGYYYKVNYLHYRSDLASGRQSVTASLFSSMVQDAEPPFDFIHSLVIRESSPNSEIPGKEGV